MLKKIGMCAAFFSGLAIMLTIVSWLMKPESNVYNAHAVELKLSELNTEQNNTIDVLFVGDSESYSAFNPLQLYHEQGIASYVCGTSYQKLCDTYALVESAYESQTPKVVVLETNCLFQEADANSEFDDIFMETAAELVPVVSYHNIWKSYIPLEKFYNIDDRFLKGFKLRKDVNPYRGGAWMEPCRKREKVPQSCQKYIARLKDFLEEKNAQLILISSPSPENWSYAKHQSVEELSKAIGVDFVDLNLMWMELGIDWNKDTGDVGNHLNFSGSKKVTRYVGAVLKERFELSDCRKDKRYDQWGKDWDKSGM